MLPSQKSSLMAWNEQTGRYEGHTKEGKHIVVSFDRYIDAVSRITVGFLSRGLDGTQAGKMSRVAMLPEFWEKRV